MADPRQPKGKRKYCPSCDSERAERYFTKVRGADGVVTLAENCNSCNAFDKAAVAAIQVSNPIYYSRLQPILPSIEQVEDSVSRSLR